MGRRGCAGGYGGGGFGNANADNADAADAADAADGLIGAGGCVQGGGVRRGRLSWAGSGRPSRAPSPSATDTPRWLELGVYDGVTWRKARLVFERYYLADVEEYITWQS